MEWYLQVNIELTGFNLLREYHMFPEIHEDFMELILATSNYYVIDFEEL